MARDTQSKSSKKEIKKTKKQEELSNKKKKADNSDSDENDESESDNEEIDVHEYRKFISKIFPSKYIDKKIKAGENLKKVIEDEEEEESKNINTKKKSKKSKKNETSDEEEEWETDEEDDKNFVKNNKKSKIIKKNKISKKNEVSDDKDEDSETSEEIKKTGKNKLNIIFTIGGIDKCDDDYSNEDDDYESDSEGYEKSDDETEDEDEEVSTDDDEDEDEDEVDEEEVSTDEDEKPEKNKTHNKIISKKNEKTDENKTTETLEQLKKLLETNPDDKSIKKCVEFYEEDLSQQKVKKIKKEKKQKVKNLRIFRKILKDKNTMNDFSFYEKIEIEHQKKIIKELREINKITRIEKPYRMTLLESEIPIEFKATAMKKINSLRYMETGSGEFYKSKNWVDTFMRIPFNTYEGLPITIDDGVDKCHDFMENAQKTLDSAVYGLNDAKMQIMQMLGQLMANPKAIGTAIAIHGPPGTGKCMVYDTPILMYNGSTKMVQDIQINDLLMGDDSTSRKVLSLGSGEDELYDVISTKGEKYGVNSEHILCLKQSGLNKIKKIKNSDDSFSYKVEYLNNQTYKIQSKRFDNLENAEKMLFDKKIENNIIEISVKNFLNLPKFIQIKLKGYKTGIEFNTKSVLFDPYIMGVWIGNGTSPKTEITIQEPVILDYVKTEISQHNLILKLCSGYTYEIAPDVNNEELQNTKNMFLQSLKDYNLLNDKHIPIDYKINNRKIRLELLAGIIDTCGSYNIKDKCFNVTQTNSILIDDIIFIARSLGFAAYKKKCIKSRNVTETYYTNIYGKNINEIPTKYQGNQINEQMLQIKNHLVYGIKIKHIGFGKYYGFTLDNNNRYLLNDFTVTHNTSLVKEGISKILNRPFAFIALGGATDSSFLEGHGYTYEGSTWGKIVQILIESKCMNPVIYFDELDKISDTPRGEEIAGILTHLTDTSQNSQFHDKYFAEINFDLSKCLFIFSYNDETKVNSILKDRMYRIKTKGYMSKEKTVIANNYLLPKIREQVRFNINDIIIPNDVIAHINDIHCNKEDGVRNLKRCLEIIYTKLNLYRLMKPGTNLFEGEMSLKVEFPFTVTKDIVEKLIKHETDGLETWRSLYL
jgi:ATP-dependent Lon protease